MDRQPVLEGDRLLLRPLRPDDWSTLYAVASDPLIWEVHPQHDRWQEPVFRKFFDQALAGGGAVAVIDKSTQTIVGSSRWEGFDPAQGGSVEIGWTFLARSHWSGAYNPELKRLMLAHALRFVARVLFRVGENNGRSRRAMEKIGGRLTDESSMVETASGLVRHVVYEIDRESFARGPLSA
ncbi:GNAT family N-acetyltransferase [Novosphingobium sp. JCM 18896]|uniref:GNAT family N-acetyltransferase n=1 Tax=Novosphingobium sp. JCM 18896 TaxID=2989731 RepID=UPI0022228672|nr:GNAT family N-acetyltransferase [Novosphingobium sp. JCM 18896]MCW1430841.1 GNAT family N-acetyltransferase [Novosphingobium sp. JCM 18896]